MCYKIKNGCCVKSRWKFFNKYTYIIYIIFNQPKLGKNSGVAF